jgi:hypothetical protein
MCGPEQEGFHLADLPYLYCRAGLIDLGFKIVSSLLLGKYLYSGYCITRKRRGRLKICIYIHTT